MTPKPRDPETAQEWQEAVDGASLMLALDSAVRYGFVRWVGPRGGRRRQDNVNPERCQEILERGRALGYRPAPLSILLRDLQVRL